MSTSSTTDFQPIVREIVNDTVPTLFEEDTFLYNKILSGDAEVVNSRGRQIPMYLSPNESDGWFAEGGQLAVPGKEEFLKGAVGIARYSKGFEFTGDLLDEFDTNKAQVVGKMVDKITRTTQTAKKYLERAIFGDGTGTLAVVSAINSLNITMASTYAGGSTFGARFLKKRGRHQFYTSGGTQHFGGAVTVSVAASKVESTGVVTYDAVPSDLAVGDLVVNENSWNKAMTGLKAIINNDTGTFQTLSRATYPVLKAGVVDAGGANISVSLLKRARQAIRFRTGDTQGKMVLISAPGQKEKFTSLGYNLIRFNNGGGGNMRLDFDSATFENMDWWESVDCEEDRIYGVNRNHLKRVELMKFGLFDRDGNIHMYLSNGTGYDKYTGWLGCKTNLYSDNPQAHFVIKNLAFDNVATGVGSLQ